VAYNQKLEFGNFTLTYGQDKVMLDMFNEILKPSFDSLRYTRKYKGTSYFFHETRLVHLNPKDSKSPIIGFTGRLVKDTTVARHQVFEKNTIQDSYAELPSAPSTVFLLILNNHRLILCKEVPNAPNLSVFHATCTSFLKSRYREYVEEEQLKRQNLIEKSHKKDPSIQLKRITKTDIYKETGEPYLRITPLTSSSDLKGYIGLFSKIKNVSIKLNKTNHEVAIDDMFRQLEKTRAQSESNSLKLNYSNNKDGLNSEQILESAKSATKLGNVDLNISGLDLSGDKLAGDNEDFKIEIEVGKIPKLVTTASSFMYEKMLSMADDGRITLPEPKISTLDKIKNIFTTLR
jgi:hypothetical protein